MLMKRTDPHTMDLVRDYPLVSEAAESRSKDNAMQRWVEEKMEGIYVRVIPDYAGCPFRHAWVKAPQP